MAKTIEEKALELYPVEIEEVRDIDSHMVIDTYDINETKMILYVKWHKEQAEEDKAKWIKFKDELTSWFDEFLTVTNFTWQEQKEYYDEFAGLLNDLDI